MMQEIGLESKAETLEQLLRKLHWLNDERVLAVESPGAGNMNVVLRIVTDQRRFILKQSRPFVQKYPQVAAPLERLTVEHAFYQRMGAQAFLPQIYHFSEANQLLMMQDLGALQDFTSLYQERNIDRHQLGALIQHLQIIHQTPPTNFPDNLDMRRLNHQHIFVLPFHAGNGFDLDTIQPGLQTLASVFQQDKRLKKRVQEVGQLYLETGKVLLHGDYYPGSWMQSADKLYVIDPEFSFARFPEFDLGVMAAHLMLASSEPGYVAEVEKPYKAETDSGLLKLTSGIEIMRRLIGLAQLPLDRSLREKQRLLDLAYNLVMD
jgi:5-methylthioribose kinase